MQDKKFSPERQSAFAARFEAQKIAFGPVVFQCVRYAWKRGMLQALADAGEEGLSILAAFGYSLAKPPSMIERFARMREPNLPPFAVAYTRTVTKVWCGFFIVNGAIALGTALWATPAVWSLYNGVIAYVLMGVLFAGEYLVRLRVQRLHHG